MNASAPAADPQFAAYIGLDWADQKHAWALKTGSGKIEQGEVENTPEAIDAWVSQLRERFQCQPIAIALEQSRGNVIAKLVKYDHLVLYPINPRSSAAYRNTFALSGAKRDPVDAVLLLELIVLHRDRLKPLKPDTVETRMLRVLVEQRRDRVDQQTAFSHQLKDLLKQIFPQALAWLGKLHTPMACDFLQRWPTLEALSRARAQTVREFFYKHNSRSPERIEERIQQREQAQPATEDRALLEPGMLMIQCLIRLLNQLRPCIEEFDAKIKAVAEAHPDFAIMHSFPGAGPVMAPRLVATLGTDRERFASATELQNFTGISPVTVKSGQGEWIHWRWACSKFDRQTVHEWAGHTRKKCEWARPYYDQQRAQGKDHHAAVRGLGYKWLRILYRCWKDGVPYDEARYLAARERATRPSGDTKKPPTAAAKKSTGDVNILFKTCGGFSKAVAIST